MQIVNDFNNGHSLFFAEDNYAIIVDVLTLRSGLEQD